ncbi:unnamed protein product [Pleuronectes platessa]|uniref:Uncharacterized protein n=1 Tax=Pleuronectes platessa TaxID=8262 RepID=A0A9N7W0R6_PLEPL|nr:unnamed protein product [Pleuronectes platessa]
MPLAQPAKPSQSVPQAPRCLTEQPTRRTESKEAPGTPLIVHALGGSLASQHEEGPRSQGCPRPLLRDSEDDISALSLYVSEAVLYSCLTAGPHPREPGTVISISPITVPHRGHTPGRGRKWGSQRERWSDRTPIKGTSTIQCLERLALSSLFSQTGLWQLHACTLAEVKAVTSEGTVKSQPALVDVGVLPTITQMFPISWASPHPSSNTLCTV